MEREATEDHLEVLAREGYFDWKALRPHLGLSHGHEQDISRSERDYADQRRACLYKWKVVKGSGATYGELIKAANKIGNRKFAETVEEVMKTPSRESTSNNTAIEKPQDTKCKQCQGHGVVYRSRNTVFDFFDGRGHFDIVNCRRCKGNDNWVKCSHAPWKDVGGICRE